MGGTLFAGEPTPSSTPATLAPPSKDGEHNLGVDTKKLPYTRPSADSAASSLSGAFPAAGDEAGRRIAPEELLRLSVAFSPSLHCRLIG